MGSGTSASRREFSRPLRAEVRWNRATNIFDDANGDLAVGELENAVKKYRQCVEIDPEFFDGWHALGMALMKIGLFPEAIEAGKRATELRPNDQIAWTSLSLSTTAMATSRKPKPRGRKRRPFLGREDGEK